MTCRRCHDGDDGHYYDNRHSNRRRQHIDLACYVLLRLVYYYDRHGASSQDVWHLVHQCDILGHMRGRLWRRGVVGRCRNHLRGDACLCLLGGDEVVERSHHCLHRHPVQQELRDDYYDAEASLYRSPCDVVGDPHRAPWSGEEVGSRHVRLGIGGGFCCSFVLQVLQPLAAAHRHHRDFCRPGVVCGASVVRRRDQQPQDHERVEQRCDESHASLLHHHHHHDVDEHWWYIPSCPHRSAAAECLMILHVSSATIDRLEVSAAARSRRLHRRRLRRRHLFSCAGESFVVHRMPGPVTLSMVDDRCLRLRSPEGSDRGGGPLTSRRAGRRDSRACSRQSQSPSGVCLTSNTDTTRSQ